MPRYVLLQHDHPALHWDFMLEWEGALRTWRLAADPVLSLNESPVVEISATRLPDHRIAYLVYEGPISGGRGTVLRCDQGQYADCESKENTIRIELLGERLRCTATLNDDSSSTHWTFQRRTA